MADKLIKITLLEEMVNRDCLNLQWPKMNVHNYQNKDINISN